MSAQPDLFEAGGRQDLAREKDCGKAKVRSKFKGTTEFSPKAQFVTIDAVMKRYAISQATVWRWVKDNPHFPEPIKLSVGTSRWLESQLEEFENRVQSRHVGKRSKTRKKMSL